MRPAGIEPALPAWQAGRLPLHHGRKRFDRIVKEQPRLDRLGGSRTPVGPL